MFGILIVATFGYLNYQVSRPLALAMAASVAILLLSLFLGRDLGAALIGALILFAYCAALFWAIDRFRHNIVAVIFLISAGAVATVFF